MFQSPSTDGSGCLGDRNQLGMRRGILQLFALIPGGCDHPSSMHDQRPDGHFVFVHGALRQF
jgi:hypothetical protein